MKGRKYENVYWGKYHTRKSYHLLDYSIQKACLINITISWESMCNTYETWQKYVMPGSLFFKLNAIGIPI